MTPRDDGAGLRALAVAVLLLALLILAKTPEWALSAVDDEPREVRTVVVHRIEGKGEAYWKRIRLEAELRAATIRRERRATLALRGRLVRALAGDTLTHPLERGLLCVHTYEGPWNSATNPIYDGGLQMDDTFQRQYGSWAVRAFGPAYRWPVSVQLAVAIRAVVGDPADRSPAGRPRGFGPWPNTRKPCGL